MIRRRLLSLGFLLCLAVPAYADFTVSGQCLYRDREFDQTGFTGVEPDLPIRHADVEVVDIDVNGKNAVRGTGSTDVAGNFSFVVTDSQVRNLIIRCLSQTEYHNDYFLDVTDLANKALPYAVVSPTFIFSFSAV